MIALAMGCLCAGCTRKPSGAGCDTATACENCCVRETVEDTFGEPYGCLDDNPGRNDNSANWTHEPHPVVVEVDVDIDSITAFVRGSTTGVALTRTEAEMAVEGFFEYWNLAGAGVTLDPDALDKDCCNSPSDVGCVDCLHDGQNDLFFWAEDSASLYPGTDSAGKTQPGFSGHCLVSMDIVLFGGTYDGGTWCPYDWTYPYSDGVEGCSDGTKDKPFKDTAIHELGHLLGIAGDDEAGFFPSSVVSGECDFAFGCSFDAVSALDARALTEMYGQCH